MGHESPIKLLLLAKRPMATVARDGGLKFESLADVDTEHNQQFYKHQRSSFAAR